MLTTKTNYHHSKLPKIGEVGYITNGVNRYNEILYYKGVKTKWQVIAFPLCDNVLPYSKGIHSVYVKNLSNGEIKRFSGFYFDSIAY